MKAKIRWQILFPESLLDRLRAFSERTGISIGEHTRRAVEDYLDRKEATIRPQPSPTVNDHEF